MNNETNNFNSNGTNMTPNGGVPVPPNPTMPVNNGMETVNPAYNGQAAPQVQPTPMPSEPVNNPGPAVVNPAPESINLQPVGVVTPVTNAPEPPPVATPLEATPLNAQTVMNPSNVGATAPMGQPMNQDAMNGMVPPVVPPSSNNNIGMIGGVPVPPSVPTDPGKKDKKKPKISMPILILLIVVLIAAIGFGIYYFLNTSETKTQASITPTLTTVELGTVLTEEARFFVRASGDVDLNACTLTTNLDTNTVGTYEYSVTCGNLSTGTQTVEVLDTTAPAIEVNEVIVTPNTEVLPEDFISSIDDASEVTFEFVDGEVDTSTEGEFEINILASDEYENTTSVVATLIVTNNAPQTYMICENDFTSSLDAEISGYYRLGITSRGELYNIHKNITYVFEDATLYNEAVAEITNSNTFDGLEGEFYTDEEGLTVEVSMEMTPEEIAEDMGLDTFPTTESEIDTLFEYTCEYED